MGRFVLAATAGFFGACTLLLSIQLFSRSEEKSLPALKEVPAQEQVSVRNDEEDIEHLVAAAPLPWRADNVAARHQHSPAPGSVRLASATSAMLPLDPPAQITWGGNHPFTIDPSTTSDPTVLFQGSSGGINLTLTTATDPEVRKPGSSDARDPDESDNNKYVYKNLDAGRWLVKSTQDDSVPDYVLDIYVVGGNDPNYTTSSEITATIGASGTEQALRAAGTNLKSDSPVKVVVSGPAMADAKIALSGGPLSDPLPLTLATAAALPQIGDNYRINMAGQLSGLLNGQSKKAKFAAVSNFKVATETAADEFEPKIAAITQSLTVGKTTKLLATQASLNSNSFLLTGNTVTVQATSKFTGRKLVLVSADNKVRSSAVETAAETPPLTSSQLNPGVHTLRVMDQWSGRVSTSFRATVPSTGTLFEPQITLAKVGEGDAKDVSGGIPVPGNQFTLIGSAQGASSLQLWVLSAADNNTYTRRQQPINVTVDATGRWQQGVTIAGSGGSFRVVAVAFNEGTHRFSNVVSVTMTANNVAATNLSIASVEAATPLSTEAKTVNKPYVISVSEAKIGVRIAPEAEDGDTLIATSNNREAGRFPFAATATEATIPVTGLKSGKNTIQIALNRGSRQSRPISLNIEVIDNGPRIVSVKPNPFGTKPGQTTLVVTFADGSKLDEDTVKDKGNYALFKNRGNSDQIDTKAAIFDSNKNQVSLTFDEPILADYYEIRVNGHKSNQGEGFTSAQSGTAGIRDIYGNLLNGDGSGRGTDFSQVLDGSSGVPGIAGFRNRSDLPSVDVPEPNLLTRRVGLPETTGPPVDYQEYTNPRPFQNGFNPSDKVVSRVARLYYYRDAHRVVQIINRRAQSYNAQNATISRQLADQARLFAEQTTDRRRSAERKAVESARSAREAENALDEYQQQARTAQEDVARGNELKRSLQSQIAVLQGEADGSATIPEGKYPNDPRTPQQRLADAQNQLATLEDQIDQAEQNQSLNMDRVNAAVAAIESLREQELQDRETMEQEQAREDRAVDHQFRLEVQAAKEDPDTYAPGDPDSADPVAQVTLSVIGEGLIQMRGPRKGVNIVHTMINQIDSPVGQVRVGIHTVQVNGERGDRMEEVVGKIGRYVDHSRFLTAQSMQMLRNAILLVASRRAQEAGYLCEDGILPVGAECDMESGIVSPEGLAGPNPGFETVEQTRFAAAQRYQDAFFGRQFMNELRAMDSEFLKNDNKLLSLHSMDTTSLASALFVLALANNDTRLEILGTFRQMVMCQLPVNEFEYFNASDMKRGILCRKFQFLGDNARFVSLRGYFNAHVDGPQTLNPAQREFIKLAQILKSRLITEIELKQRVLERALIEERLGDYEQQLRFARLREEAADRELREHRKTFQDGITSVVTSARNVKGAYEAWLNVVEGYSQETYKVLNLGFTHVDDVYVRNRPATAKKSALNVNQLKQLRWNALKILIYSEIGQGRQLNQARVRFMDVFRKEAVAALPNGAAGISRPAGCLYPDVVVKLRSRNKPVVVLITAQGNAFVHKNDLETVKQGLEERIAALNSSQALQFLTKEQRRVFDCLMWNIEQVVAAIDTTAGNNNRTDDFYGCFDLFKILFEMELSADFAVTSAWNTLEDEEGRFHEIYGQIDELLRAAVTASIEGKANVASAHLQGAHSLWIQTRSKLKERNDLDDDVDATNKAFAELLEADLALQFTAAAAKEARRPLDHKKFLDLLIDDVEEKFIELVEGTRAQTSVIDDYIKRIATALDDDLNTQFYDPMFRRVREETYGCSGVSFGQIETTNVLTNNREFAKVQPQATMEFDLPRRRIVIAEAMQAAQAAYADYGALVNDPGFLALTKLNSGQPTAATYSNSDGNPAVRDVLPGLPSQTNESSVVQSRTGQPKFESQLEALIPDPAIYKFETGTGFEIRPVIQPDGQSVVFDFNYMYTTNIREPVRADEKHLGRVKRHFVDTDVQIGNFELREVSRYRVALKAERTSQGVPLLQDIPIAGALFRPLPSAESSLQQNLILAKTVIFPTLYDLMGLRWAPAVADLDINDMKNQEFVYRNRMRWLKNEVYDYSSTQVDEFLRIPVGERRADLYRTQKEIPLEHPNLRNPTPLGTNRQDSPLQEGHTPPPQSGLLIPGQTWSAPAAGHPAAGIGRGGSAGSAFLKKVPANAGAAVQKMTHRSSAQSSGRRNRSLPADGRSPVGRVRLNNPGEAKDVSARAAKPAAKSLRELKAVPLHLSTSAEPLGRRPTVPAIRQVSHERDDTAGRVSLSDSAGRFTSNAPAKEKTRKLRFRLPFQKK